jgi:uncharacterized 2Fe-2S/4Fe-4S cluster protein (DUF4445 family)
MTAGTVRIRLEPLAIEIDVPSGATLSSVLAQHAVEFPCGGTGLCGGCRVRVLAGSLSVTDQDRAFFSADDLAHGWRLACQARAESPITLECGQWQMDVLTDNSALSATGKSGLGIAIDLGTTTIAAQLLDLATGVVLAVETELNPQASSGSDVMSRINAVLSGADLTTPIRSALRQIIVRLAHGREPEIAEVVLVGNTVMHHLFSGLSVEPLAHAPFESPNFRAQIFSPSCLAWPLPTACRIRFERCLGGFVGSDILAGIVATGMARSGQLTALIDLGTNGDIAMGNRHGIVCASTAAGPAFEAGSIRMGMRASTGAISSVSLKHGRTHAKVIGDVTPRGICGSGLVDAVAAGLATHAILPSGRIDNAAKLFPVAPPVVLHQSDIRELQLAKAAIAAGFKLLLRPLGAQVTGLESIHLAGAFGNYVQIPSAIAIGLLDAPPAIIHPAGNTALRGAKMLLLAANNPALPSIQHISLATDPNFQDEFANCMTFPSCKEIDLLRQLG